MSSRKQYQQRVKEKLQELELEVDRLRAQIKDVEEELVPEQHEHFQRLHAMLEKTRTKFNELVDASDDSFDSLKDNMEDYWSSLGREIKAFDQKLK